MTLSFLIDLNKNEDVNLIWYNVDISIAITWDQWRQTLQQFETKSFAYIVSLSDLHGVMINLLMGMFFWSVLSWRAKKKKPLIEFIEF